MLYLIEFGVANLEKVEQDALNNCQEYVEVRKS